MQNTLRCIGGSSCAQLWSGGLSQNEGEYVHAQQCVVHGAEVCGRMTGWVSVLVVASAAVVHV